MGRNRSVVGVTMCLGLVLAASLARAQWYPPQQQHPYPSSPQHPQTPQYPQSPPYPQTPSSPGGAPPSSYPTSPAGAGMPSGAVPGAVQPGGQAFSDAFGRFRVTLPPGTMPVGAIYNFMNPAATSQIAIQAVGHEQMFQMNLQSFPAMMRQMGATVEPEQSLNVRGKQARLFAATMRDQQSGTAMRSLNVFISDVFLWIQVMGPEQNGAQLQQTLQTILAGLQF